MAARLTAAVRISKEKYMRPISNGFIEFLSRSPFLKNFRPSICCVALVFLACESNAQMTADELSQAIKSPNAVAKIGVDLFGDQINLYNGSLQFNQLDVSLRGNSALPVSVGRRFVTGIYSVSRRPFGEWELDIPHLHGVFSSQYGWTDQNQTNARCSGFSAPAEVLVNGGMWSSSEFWQGNYMYVPGHGDQQLLARDSANTNVPSPASNYPVVTANSWVLSCISSLANAPALGEGFLATSPAGTKYQFDHIISYAARPLSKPAGPGGALTASIPSATKTGLATASSAALSVGGVATPHADMNYSLPRKEVRILPTLITDRHGNWVRYTYDSIHQENLKTITSSDGRTITFTYAYGDDPKVITSVTDGTRTWRYAYHTVSPGTSSAAASIDTVTLPDGSSWRLTNINRLQRHVSMSGFVGCGDRQYPSEAISGSMVHPSGATGSFTLTATTHGRSGVVQSSAGTPPSDRNPIYFYTRSLTSKTIGGPGVPALTWRYTYDAPVGSYSTCVNCATSKAVNVVDPAGATTRYTFGNYYRVSEGRLERVDVGWNGASAVRTTIMNYQPPGAGPYPALAGYGGENISDGEALARLMPLSKKVITQQGEAFTWEATAFNRFAQVTQVTRASTRGPSRSETTDFNNNLTKWILGQTERVTETDSQKVMVLNGYNALTANLESVSLFGKIQKQLGYNTDGTLATIKDGRNYITTFSDYFRGVARNILRADGRSERRTVNAYGAISSTTDANGYVTQYEYDPLGRLARITPPADTVAWNPTVIKFAPVPVTEYDLAPGHWRQDVTVGNSQIRTYFDALWRPVYSYTADLGNPAGTSSIVKRRYDFDGRTVFESYPQRSTPGEAGINSRYDALGRIVETRTDSELGVLVGTATYDSGFRTSQMNARGHATVITNSAFDDPDQAFITNIAAQEGVNVSFAKISLARRHRSSAAAAARALRAAMSTTMASGCARPPSPRPAPQCRTTTPRAIWRGVRQALRYRRRRATQRTLPKQGRPDLAMTP